MHANNYKYVFAKWNFILNIMQGFIKIHLIQNACDDPGSKTDAYPVLRHLEDQWMVQMDSLATLDPNQGCKKKDDASYGFLRVLFCNVVSVIFVRAFRVMIKGLSRNIDF